MLLRLIEGVWFFPAAWVFNHGQGIFTAKLIGTLTEQTQICFVVVVVLAVRKGNGVDHKVIMQTVRVKVGCDNDLKSVAPHFLGKFNADLVSLFWRKLPRLKALKTVIADNFTFIVPLCFGNQHFISGGCGVAVYARDKKLLLGLVAVGSVFHHISESLQVRFGVFRVGCLFWILGIVDGVVEPATYIPYLADRH